MKFDFSFIRKSVQSLSSQVASLRAEIAKVQSERDAVLNAPASRDDVKAMVSAWAEARSGEYTKGLRVQLEYFIRHAAQLADPAVVKHRMTVFGSSQQVGSDFFAGAALSDRAVCALMGALVVKGLHEAIDRMEWPEGALPLAGREKRIADIDRALAALLAEEADMVSTARAAGVIFE